jgi:tripartite ATP-independent transporter DctP family solute receptor
MITNNHNVFKEGGKKMKKNFSIVTLCSIALACMIFTPTFVSADDMKVDIPYIKPVKKELRLAHGLTPGSPYDKGCHRFAELVEMYTRGEIKIKIFPSAQLGKEQVTAKMVQIGTLDISLQAVNNSTMWYRPMDIYIMPFIFRDREHVNKVLFGSVGQKLEQEYIKASGMRIVSWFEWGDRSIFNKVKAITKPDDLNGVKIRVPKNPVMVDTYNTLGANATAIDWGELYSALQQGLADGLEGPPQGMIDMKFYDFLKYYSYINVFYGLADLVINEKFFQGLSKENQEALLRAGREAGAYQRWISTVSHVEGLENLAKLGVKVNKVKDRQAFVDKVQPVWSKYRKKLGDELFDAIINTK